MPKPADPNQLTLWGDDAPPLFSADSAGGREDTARESALPGMDALASETAPPGSFAARRPMRLLLADDEAPNRTALRALLKRLGYACREAADGREAVERFTEDPADCVFLDVDMPGMDGLEAARAMRERERAQKGSGRARIVAVTANVAANTAERCARAGMDGRLAKPADLKEVRGELEKAWQRLRDRRRREASGRQGA